MKHSFIILSSFFLIFGCGKSNKTKPNPTVPPKYAITKEPIFQRQGMLVFVSPTNDSITTIDIELAATPQKREMGLMYRSSMKEDQGMLFVFDAEERQSFWMKNTQIPLDIIFINQSLSIVHIAENCQPYSLESIPSFEYAKFAVEVPAGFSKKYRLKPSCGIRYNLLEES